MKQKLWFYLLARTYKLSNQQLIQIMNQTTQDMKYPLSIAEIGELLVWKQNQKAKFEKSYFELLNNIDNVYRYFIEDSFITIDDEVYPKLLKEIYNAPAILFYRGNLDLLKNRKVAFIGSRKAEKEILKILDQLLPPLIKKNFVIVSGLATGADTWSHQKCIYHHGKTIAVVGNGLDYYYPSSNRRLQEVISDKHLLLSEYPIGTKPKKFHFPLRNRIIAGLVEGVCVLQAGIKSGTEITANLALDEGREVFAIPNTPLNPNFQGCNFLIQEGAKLVISAEDILNSLSLWRSL